MEATITMLSTTTTPSSEQFYHGRGMGVVVWRWVCLSRPRWLAELNFGIPMLATGACVRLQQMP